MSGHHSAARPGREDAPRLASPSADFFACFANDNQARPVLPQGLGRVEAVVLACETENGMPIVVLRARMKGGGLVPLAKTRDPDDFVALWRGLGRELNAALEVVDRQGNTKALTHNPGDVSFPRWRGSNVARRRTRFSRKRVAPLADVVQMPNRIEESA
jgi:hypothetical protein